MSFKGFSDKETFTPLPDSFFHQLLNEIDDVDELKVTLHALWQIGNMEGRLHMLREKDFAGIAAHPAPALHKAVQRGSLLEVRKGSQVFYFLNSPRGRATAEAFSKGQKEMAATPSTVSIERPNLFKLYEENIGPLTPIIADTLKDAEQTYPEEWVAEALEIAVKSNKRNWKYVEAILRRWKEEGHGKKQDRRDAEEPRGRDVTRKVEDFLKR